MPRKEKLSDGTVVAVVRRFKHAPLKGIQLTIGCSSSPPRRSTSARKLRTHAANTPRSQPCSTLRRIEQFRTGDDPVFLISLKAGGTGLTLTEADYVFVLDPWWNPAAEDQAVDRAHRIGQTRSVMVYRLVAADTIEEKVMALKQRKAALFASVFTGEGAVGQGIDADDVRSLFL